MARIVSNDFLPLNFKDGRIRCVFFKNGVLGVDRRYNSGWVDSSEVELA
jgi:hypothetical protein